MYQFNRKEYEERMKWYQDARFGMFIHWGLYSIPARGEWVRSTEEMPEEEYLPFIKEFDARDYNPKQWAREAKAAGMKYVVLTAKHHDGFCLFDSKYTDYKVTNTPAGRDLIKEYVEALREEGLKVGLYFTLLDSSGLSTLWRPQSSNEKSSGMRKRKQRFFPLYRVSVQSG